MDKYKFNLLILYILKFLNIKYILIMSANAFIIVNNWDPNLYLINI